MAEKILVVDDDKDYLLATKLTLEADSYEVTTAASADEAAEQLRSSRPDLILLDVMMPEKDGLQLVKELQDNPDLSGIPIVLVTAVAENPGMMMNAFERDIMLTPVEIIPKTAVQRDLSAAVRRCLAGGGEE